MNANQKFNFLTPRAAGSGTGGCRGQSPLPCTPMGKACKKPFFFEENWMKFLKMLVLTLNSLKLLRQKRLKLRFLFFFFYMPIFQSIFKLNTYSSFNKRQNEIQWLVFKYQQQMKLSVSLIKGKIILQKNRLNIQKNSQK